MFKINPVKRTYLFFGSAVLSAILHNLIYGIFEIEEAVFFILTFVFILAFIISLVVNVITYVKKGEPKNLWKLGFLGLFGLIGLLGSDGFFGFFGLLVFFLTKKAKK